MVADSGTETADPRFVPGIGAFGRRGARIRRRERARAEAERRVYFTERWIGVLLIVPQLLLIFTFFYWPTAQALYWAFTLEQPWGGGNAWVGLANFTAMLSDPVYWGSIWQSIVFAASSTTREFAGTLVVRKTLAPMVLPAPTTVSPPMIVAPAYTVTRSSMVG